MLGSAVVLFGPDLVVFAGFSLYMIAASPTTVNSPPTVAVVGIHGATPLSAA